MNLPITKTVYYSDMYMQTPRGSNFSANIPMARPIIDRRPFLSSQDFWLLGIATTLTGLFIYMVVARKVRPHVRAYRRKVRRRRIEYHRSRLSSLRRKKRSTSGLEEVRVGGQAVKLSELPVSVRQKIRGAA